VTALAATHFPLLVAKLNVKRVEFARSGNDLVTLDAKPNFRELGKEFGKRTPLAAQAVAAFDGEQLRAFLRGEPLVVSVVQEEGGFSLVLNRALALELSPGGMPESSSVGYNVCERSPGSSPATEAGNSEGAGRAVHRFRRESRPQWPSQG